MVARAPAVAGQFYPAAREECRAAIEECLAEAWRVTETTLPAGFRAVGGVVPHAGWICSGAVAGEVIALLADRAAPETFVVFGAVHRRMGVAAAAYDGEAWGSPLGEMPIDVELIEALAGQPQLVALDADIHDLEHSIEVEVPFIQYLAPDARLLPVMVPPTAAAALVGRAVADAASQVGRKVAFLGSTDLTHYGPRYGFVPHGIGAEGLRWAKEVNDRRMLDLMARFRVEEIVREAAASRNACGGGAITATMAACQAAGATEGRILRHTSSSEVLRSRYGDMEDAVGYAGVVFGAP